LKRRPPPRRCRNRDSSRSRPITAAGFPAACLSVSRDHAACAAGGQAIVAGLPLSFRKPDRWRRPRRKDDGRCRFVSAKAGPLARSVSDKMSAARASRPRRHHSPRASVRRRWLGWWRSHPKDTRSRLRYSGRPRERGRSQAPMRAGLPCVRATLHARRQGARTECLRGSSQSRPAGFRPGAKTNYLRLPTRYLRRPRNAIAFRSGCCAHRV
jgi:hypothetical protein